MRTKLASCLLIFTCCTLPLIAQESQYNTLISRADALVKQADYVGALGAAQKAIRLNDSDFRGYYYGAFALYKQNLLTEAEPFVDRALALAPAADKPDVEELVSAIHNSGSYQAEVQQGDQAMQSGQTAVAAEAYTKAWEARRNDQKTGLKAAKLWGDRLNEFGKANQILQYIVDHPGDPDTLAEAQQLLGQYKPALTNNYNERINAGNQAINSGSWLQAKSAFEDAVASNPGGSYLAHLNLALIDVHNKNEEGAIQELRAAATDPNASSATVISFLMEGPHSAEFSPFFDHPNFVNAVRDGFGPSAARRLEEVQQQKIHFLQVQKGETVQNIVGHWRSDCTGDRQCRSDGGIDISEQNGSLVASGEFWLESRTDKVKYSGRVTSIQEVPVGNIATAALSDGRHCGAAYLWLDGYHCWILNGEFEESTEQGQRSARSATFGLGSNAQGRVDVLIINVAEPNNKWGIWLYK